MNQLTQNLDLSSLKIVNQKKNESEKKRVYSTTEPIFFIKLYEATGRSPLKMSKIIGTTPSNISKLLRGDKILMIYELSAKYAYEKFFGEKSISNNENVLIAISVNKENAKSLIEFFTKNGIAHKRF